MPALGWDGFTPDVDERHRQLFLLDNHGRRPVLARMDNRNPFPPRFMAGSNRDLNGKLGMCFIFPFQLLARLLICYSLKISAVISLVLTVIMGSSLTQMMVSTRCSVAAIRLKNPNRETVSQIRLVSASQKAS